MKKKQAKYLRSLAETMPTIMRHTQEYHEIPGIVLLNQGETHVNGEPINPIMKYKQAMPVMIAINHGRKLKKMYQQHKMAGIRAYCTAVKQHEIIEKQKDGN